MDSYNNIVTALGIPSWAFTLFLISSVRTCRLISTYIIRPICIDIFVERNFDDAIPCVACRMSRNKTRSSLPFNGNVLNSDWQETLLGNLVRSFCMRWSFFYQSYIPADLLRQTNVSVHHRNNHCTHDHSALRGRILERKGRKKGKNTSFRSNGTIMNKNS